MPSFHAIDFFVDLLVTGLLVLPLFAWLRRPAARQLLLIVWGTYLLAVIAPRLALFHVAYWLLVVLLLQVVRRAPEGRAGRWALGTTVVAALTPLVVWRLWPLDFVERFNVYGHQLLASLSPGLGDVDAVHAIVIPLGLSFSAFRAIDLMVQVRLGVLACPRPLAVLAYALFPPILVVGPVAPFSEVHRDEEPALGVADLRAGLVDILIGTAKVYVLAFPLQGSVGVFDHFEAHDPGTLWLQLVLFTWYFYLNFAGFSDIAVGCARLLGRRVSGNFDAPYLKTSPQAFWASWHMSLTRFAQRNVFVPCGGYRQQTQYIAVVATMMVIALWHDLTLPLILFGVYHSAGLCLNRFWDNRRRARRQKPSTGIVATHAARLGTYAFVTASFPLLLLPMGALGAFYSSLFGLA